MLQVRGEGAPRIPWGRAQPWSGTDTSTVHSAGMLDLNAMHFKKLIGCIDIKEWTRLKIETHDHV